MAFSVEDYWIEASGVDWSTALDTWGWLLPELPAATQRIEPIGGRWE